jgi:tRNA G46 methylase TrmB
MAIITPSSSPITTSHRITNPPKRKVKKNGYIHFQTDTPLSLNRTTKRDDAILSVSLCPETWTKEKGGEQEQTHKKKAKSFAEGREISSIVPLHTLS